MTAAANTRLVIADDHPLFRDALRQAVASVLNSARVDEAGTFDELTALLEQDSDVDLIVGQQVEDAAHGIPPSNTVSVKRLAARDRERLRVALGAVAFAGELARDMLFRD